MNSFFSSVPSSDSADKVVQRTGKFEELVVASHDIAASTAQLVAASRVKARPKSEKLKSLKSSSRAGMYSRTSHNSEKRIAGPKCVHIETAWIDISFCSV